MQVIIEPVVNAMAHATGREMDMPTSGADTP